MNKMIENFLTVSENSTFIPTFSIIMKLSNKTFDLSILGKN